VSWDLLDWYIIGPAIAAGLLVLSTHVPLGQVVLQRGIIFIDLAIAQVAALGVITAGAMGWEENIYAVQFAAVGLHCWPRPGSTGPKSTGPISRKP
jgi:zinc/manganese transport system permease protein